MDFDSIEELYRYVNTVLKEVMEHEITEAIVEVLMQKVQSEVFDAYTPYVYERRTYNGTGGLGSRESFISLVDVMDDSIQLQITNIAEKVWSSSSKTLAELIEYGEGDSAGRPWLAPRPFFEVAEKELKSTNLVEEVLQKALPLLFN